MEGQPIAQLLDWLAEGDLRSDGLANEVVTLTLQNPGLVVELLDALSSDNDAVRGHAADALEKVGRSRPDLFFGEVGRLGSQALQDPVPMVRWHLAMLLGHLAIDEDQAAKLYPTLIEMLDDKSVFVRSWVITSLCIICRQLPTTCPAIIERVERMTRDKSVAIRTRAAKALDILIDAGQRFPEGWIKSEHLSNI